MARVLDGLIEALDKQKLQLIFFPLQYLETLCHKPHVSVKYDTQAAC